MTAGADAGNIRQRLPAARLVLACTLVAVVAFGSACTATTPDPTPPSSTSTPGTAGGSPGSAIPLQDGQAIRATIDTINATAGGSVTDQQAVLASVVDPALEGAFRGCSPPPTTTLRFEPVYAGLRATPDWTAANGTPGGTVYALPVLIRIFTGDRITGTDLTTLHLGVHDGEASITPLCVG